MRKITHITSCNGGVTFEADAELLAYCQKNKDKTLVLELKRYYEKRSLTANAYFWKLCSELAIALGSTKEEVYLRQLYHYGVFVDMDVARDAVKILENNFRCVELLEDMGGDMVTARCYFGSSTYDRREMAYLINGTVEDCQAQGIDTWTRQEIQQVIDNWEVVK